MLWLSRFSEWLSTGQSSDFWCGADSHDGRRLSEPVNRPFSAGFPGSRWFRAARNPRLAKKKAIWKVSFWVVLQVRGGIPKVSRDSVGFLTLFIVCRSSRTSAEKKTDNFKGKSWATVERRVGIPNDCRVSEDSLGFRGIPWDSCGFLWDSFGRLVILTFFYTGERFLEGRNDR